MCLTTQMKYVESEDLKDENNESYTVKSEFIWNCKIMRWVDDKIRVIYYVVNRDQPRFVG